MNLRTITSLALTGELTAGVGTWSAPSAHAQDTGPVVLSEGHVVPESASEVPGWVADAPEFAFLGEPGETIYLLPDTQTPGLLWPGANTQRLRSADLDGDVELRITRVAGPGHLKLYTIDDFGSLGRLMVDSADPGVDDAWEVLAGSHAHYNWVFTAPGRYTVTAQARARLAGGTPIETVEVGYTFVVGELPGGDPGDVSQLIVTTIDESQGALVISVDPGDREVVLPALALVADGGSLEAFGELRPVTVTDTRAGAPGWSASGQVSRFTTVDGRALASGYLGGRRRR